jgi:hypothetical protein
MKKLRSLQAFLFVLLALFGLCGCMGGGGADGGRGIEGTGVRTLVTGVVRDAQGQPLEGASVSTDDAAAETSSQGTFSLETEVETNESVEMHIATGTVEGTISLEPVVPEPSQAVQIEVKVDGSTGAVSLEKQELVARESLNEEIDDTVDDVLEEIDDINDDLNNDDEEIIDPFNPDLVGFE